MRKLTREQEVNEEIIRALGLKIYDNSNCRYFMGLTTKIIFPDCDYKPAIDQVERWINSLEGQNLIENTVIGLWSNYKKVRSGPPVQWVSYNSPYGMYRHEVYFMKQEGGFKIPKMVFNGKSKHEAYIRALLFISRKIAADEMVKQELKVD